MDYVERTGRSCSNAPVERPGYVEQMLRSARRIGSCGVRDFSTLRQLLLLEPTALAFHQSCLLPFRYYNLYLSISTCFSVDVAYIAGGEIYCEDILHIGGTDEGLFIKLMVLLGLGHKKKCS